MDVKLIPHYEQIDAIIRRLAYQYFWKDVDQYERALTHPVSWLVAGAPFLAECVHPTRWAATNLGTLMNAKNNPEYFRADASDDLASRIRPILQKEGIGKPTVMRKIGLLLQLILITSYESDQEKDAKNGQYNPISDPDGPLNAESERTRLKNELAECGEVASVDAIIRVENIEDSSIARQFWF